MTYKKVAKLIDKSAAKMSTEAKLAVGDLREHFNKEFEAQKLAVWMNRINNGLPLHKNYTYTVQKTLDKTFGRVGVEVELVGKFNGKSKMFWIAGDKDPRAISGHMKTLTDEQCDSLVGIKFKGAKNG